jgi:preflagellin peptidase FlaK
VFSLTILTNTVLVGATYPLALAVRNAVAGRLSARTFVARPASVDGLDREYGRLLGEGIRGGLDLDALRMYLQWRGTSLDALRAAPERHRDPSSVDATHPPGDGAVRSSGGTPDRERPSASDAGGDGSHSRIPATPPESGASPSGEGEREGESADRPTETDAGSGQGEDAPATEPEDPWGAAQFLASLEGTAYGTTPEELRAGLDRIAASEEVWITPGLPFLVPTFAGLCLALTLGDLLFLGVGIVGTA